MVFKVYVNFNLLLCKCTLALIASSQIHTFVSSYVSGRFGTRALSS